MPLFELKIPDNNLENNLEGKSAAKLVAYENLQTSKIKIIQENIPVPPKPGEVIFCYTTNQFNTMAFIVWIIRTIGKIRSLTITTYSIGATSINTTYSIGATSINTIMKWYDAGHIEEIYFYIASYTKRISPKNIDLLTSQASARDRVTVSFGFNHSKILLAETDHGHFVITGSGNFSENAYNEQYTICNDERIYKFYYDCIREDSPE